MIYVGIDVAKDKHDCCILGSDGEVLFSPFTIQNTLQGFDELYEKIWSLTYDLTEINTISTFCARSLITACPALLSTRYIQIFTEKVNRNVPG